MLPRVSSGRIAFGVLELLLGIGLLVAGQRMSRRARGRGGSTPVAALVLQVLGVVLLLYGLLQFLFAAV
jgi:hypothetical protein